MPHAEQVARSNPNADEAVIRLNRFLTLTGMPPNRQQAANPASPCSCVKAILECLTSSRVEADGEFVCTVSTTGTERPVVTGTESEEKRHRDAIGLLAQLSCTIPEKLPVELRVKSNVALVP